MNHTVPNNCWRTRNHGKVSGDEGWGGEVVTWSVLSWAVAEVEAAAPLIDGNTTTLKL